MARFLWVCLAGAIGTGARYLVGIFAARALGAGFPWGTLIVNVVGCFFMSIVAYAGAKAALSPDLRVVLATGFLGGLTTYSAFNWDTILLVQNGPGLGLVNLAVTLFGCLASGALGLALAHAMVG
jgi:fluoride exporter